MKQIFCLTLACVAMLVFNAGEAKAGMLYNFSITHDGSSPSVDATSDTIAGTVLFVGDQFNIDIHTADPWDYWVASSSGASLGIYASFFALPGSSRTGNVVTKFFLDGALVAQDVDMGIIQSNAHFGAQSFSLAANLKFDQVLVHYEYLNGPTTTISSNGISFQEFYNDNELAYVAGVPEPTSLALWSLGLVGMTFARRRRS